jgi:hypothetical protein
LNGTAVGAEELTNGRCFFTKIDVTRFEEGLIAAAGWFLNCNLLITNAALEFE